MLVCPVHKFNRPWRRFYLKIIDSFESLFCIFFHVKNPWKMKLIFYQQFIYSAATEFILFWLKLKTEILITYAPTTNSINLYWWTNKHSIIFLSEKISIWNCWQLKSARWNPPSCFPPAKIPLILSPNLKFPQAEGLTVKIPRLLLSIPTKELIFQKKLREKFLTSTLFLWAWGLPPGWSSPCSVFPQALPWALPWLIFPRPGWLSSWLILPLVERQGDLWLI